MTFKRVVSFLLISTLSTVLILSGCSKAQKNVDNPSSEVKTGDAKKDEPKKPISVALYDRGNTPAEEGTVDNNRWTKWIKENVHAEITYVTVPRWESVQKLNVMFAAGTAPDLIPEYDASFKKQLYAQKKIIPVNEMIEKYSKDYKKLLEKYPDLKKTTMYDDGKMYEFGGVGTVMPNHTMLIRSDWLKKLNLKAPETIDEFYEVLKAFVEKDPDGNGKKDTFGINLSFVGGMLVDAMYGNAAIVFEDGSPVKDWDRIKDALEFKKKLYDAGIVDKEYMLDKNGQKAQQDWVNGNLGVFGANSGAFGIYGNNPYKTFYETFKKNVPDAQVDAISLPKTKYGRYAPVMGSGMAGAAVVNASAKNLDAIMNYVDFFSNEDNVKKLKTGPDGTYAKLTDKGFYENIVDDDKIKKEVSYNADIGMLKSAALLPLDPFDGLKMSEPMQKEWQQVRINAYKAYLNKDLKYSLTNWYSPSLPTELAAINASLNGADNKISSIMVKAITNGTSYTVDQAIAEAKDIWEKGGGKQLEDAWKKWYEQNKNNLAIYQSVVTNMKGSYEPVISSLK